MLPATADVAEAPEDTVVLEPTAALSVLEIVVALLDELVVELVVELPKGAEKRVGRAEAETEAEVAAALDLVDALVVVNATDEVLELCCSALFIISLTQAAAASEKTSK